MTGIAALLLAVAALILPPCPTEDSDQCYWNAVEHGNGQGTSFIAVDGRVTYLDGTP